jgi:hypothetical protein
MKALLSTAAVLIAAGSSLSAQADARSTITVYPFGVSRTVQLSRDLADQSARRAMEGINNTGRLNVKDQTADKAIQAQVEAAGGLSQFNAVKPIERDKQLQTKYILVGFIENAEVKGSTTDTKGKLMYAASIGVTLQISDVETGAVADSKLVLANNGVAVKENCKGFGPSRIQCEARNRTIDETNKRLSIERADTPQKALADATNKMDEVAAQFINDAFAAGKIK